MVCPPIRLPGLVGTVEQEAARHGAGWRNENQGTVDRACREMPAQQQEVPLQGCEPLPLKTM